jgi:preprotein translocase subunit SecE
LAGSSSLSTRAKKKINMSEKTGYIREVVDELKNKVSWPTWQELQTSSIIVLVTSVIIALIIFVMDFVTGINGDSVWKGILGFYYDFKK